jgi:uncharacterized protein
MSMILDVAKIREPRHRIARTDQPSAFEADEAYRILAPVELEADLRKDHEKIRLTGSLRTVLELECSRCLEGYTLPVDTTFDLLYLPAAEAPAQGGEREVEEDDLDTAFYRDGIIDLAGLVREQLYLALPMKPLCREDCRGLCPACGTNLNTSSCSCANEWEDPRLAPLRALARDDDDA